MVSVDDESTNFNERMEQKNDTNREQKLFLPDTIILLCTV